MRRDRNGVAGVGRLKSLLIFAAFVGVAGVLLAFLMTTTGVKEVKLEAYEFGFNGVSGGPTIRIKTGEPLRIVLTNKGGAEHEFMVVKDRSAFLKEFHDKLEELQARGMDERSIINSEELEEIHHHSSAVMLSVNGKPVADVNVKPGETKPFTLKFDKPGTYHYVCAELELTFPKTHADRGMYGSIIVEQ
ncbi:MAG: hypothetical protein QXO30_03025 [Candidatus Caldarchaeum sp.]